MRRLSDFRALVGALTAVAGVTGCDWPVGDDGRGEIALRILETHFDSVSAAYREAGAETGDPTQRRVIFVHPMQGVVDPGDVVARLSRRIRHPFVAIRSDSTFLVARADSTRTPDGRVMIFREVRDREMGIPVWQVAIDSIRGTGPRQATAVLSEWDWLGNHYEQSNWQLSKTSEGLGGTITPRD